MIRTKKLSSQLKKYWLIKSRQKSLKASYMYTCNCKQTNTRSILSRLRFDVLRQSFAPGRSQRKTCVYH